MWVADPADHSIAIRAFVGQRVRAPTGEEYDDDLSRSPSQRQRSMQFSTVRAIPLRVPSIPHLWDVFTDQQILLAGTSDPLALKFPFAM